MSKEVTVLLASFVSLCFPSPVTLVVSDFPNVHSSVMMIYRVLRLGLVICVCCDQDNLAWLLSLCKVNPRNIHHVDLVQT